MATKLTTKRVEKVWGRHDLAPWFASVPEGGEAVGEIWYEMPGVAADVPELLVKVLFTSEKLSIQVHPDDDAARAAGYARGKSEAWVVLAADPDATIALGLNQPTTREHLREAALDGSIEELVDWKRVRAGDSYYSGAGTVHAIGPGLAIVEVQQNVDLTYRLYDYGRPRELHLDAGIAVSEPVPFVVPPAPISADGRTILVDQRAFVLERWRRDGTGTLSPADGRPCWVVVLTEGGRIGDAALAAGEVWYVETDEVLELPAGSDLLVAYPNAGVAETLWQPAR